MSNEETSESKELMKNALKKLSEGVKVCMEICIVAAEERLVPEGKEVIAIAGTSPSGFEDGGGADTALVMVPWKSERFNKLPEKAKRKGCERDNLQTEITPKKVFCNFRKKVTIL